MISTSSFTASYHSASSGVKRWTSTSNLSVSDASAFTSICGGDCAAGTLQGPHQLAEK